MNSYRFATPARPSKRRTILERPYGRCRRPGFLSTLRVLEIVHFANFWAIGTEKNDTGRELEPNALIGVEFFEFRQKLKNYEFRGNSSFWQSQGAIWIDSVLFEVVPPILFFSFFSWEYEFQDLALKFQNLVGNFEIWGRRLKILGRNLKIWGGNFKIWRRNLKIWDRNLKKLLLLLLLLFDNRVS